MSDQDVPSGSGADPAITGPAGFSPPGPEDLLWLRIAAALIDLAVLAGVLVILSAATRQMTTSTSVQFSLNGAWRVVFLAFALLYYFVLEAWAGQTLGKLLLDPRILPGRDTNVAWHVQPPIVVAEEKQPIHRRVPGVTIRCSRRHLGSSRVMAAITARSAQSGFGQAT